MNRFFASLVSFCALGFFAASSWASADTFGTGLNSFDIEFVTIGNPGNAADTTGNPNPVGSVPYDYRIGKFEISEQMIDKANAEGGLGITRSNRGPDKPATNVTWNEAARFVNWLNTSTGSTPAYKFAIEPGEPGYNTFQDILLWDPLDPGYDPNNFFRNSKAKYFLPSVDEWYKAAYNDASGVYYDYPTGSDSLPTSVTSGTAAGTAVVGHSFAQGPADITLAGGLSAYGTMGQGGNAGEWQETEIDFVNNSPTSARAIRGGAWLSASSTMASSTILSGSPSLDITDTTFRVASVFIPEPSSLLLLGIGLAWGLSARRWNSAK